MKLYVVTRHDLSPGAQVVQTCFVLRRFVYEHPRLGAKWLAEANTLALLTVPDEGALERLVKRAQELAIVAASVREPDYHNTFTALALEPSPATKKLVAHLPRALTSKARGF